MAQVHLLNLFHFVHLLTAEAENDYERFENFVTCDCAMRSSKRYFHEVHPISWYYQRKSLQVQGYEVWHKRNRRGIKCWITFWHSSQDIPISDKVDRCIAPLGFFKVDVTLKLEPFQQGICIQNFKSAGDEVCQVCQRCAQSAQLHFFRIGMGTSRKVVNFLRGAELEWLVEVWTAERILERAEGHY